MNRYSIEIFYQPWPQEKTLSDRMKAAYQILELLGGIDSLLMPKEWLLATGDKDGSFRYPAFENAEAGPALLAFHRERYSRKGESHPRSCTLWNGQLEKGHRASLSIGYNTPQPALETISISLDDIDEWHDWKTAARFIQTCVALYSPKALFIQPAKYEPVFYDKPSVGWMLYLPRALTPSEVPEAHRLEPVLDVDGKRLGTIVISITDGILDVNNPEHINLAHDIEIRLADQDLLPRYPLLSTQ